MKNGLAGLFLAGLMFTATTSPVRADPILFDADGAGGANGTIQIGSLGLGTGNSLAKNSIAGGSIIAPGSTFQLFYQARLSDVSISPGGGSTTPTGLNTPAGFEITVIASVTEEVVSVTGSGGGAQLKLAAVQSPTSFIRLYYHPGQLSDNFTGAGFGAGTLILSATPDGTLPSAGNFTVSTDANGRPVGVSAFDQFDSPSLYPGVLSVEGAGAGRFGGIVNFYDPNFFKSSIHQLTINSFNNVPFDATTPSSFFNDATGLPTVAVNRGLINGVSGPDFQFQSRTTVSFSAVPEPGSIGLSIVGLVGILGYGRRMKKRSV